MESLSASVWVTITSFITDINPRNHKKKQEVSKEEEEQYQSDAAPDNEQTLRYICKNLYQLFTSEEYYHAKVMETFSGATTTDRNVINSTTNNLADFAASVGGWRMLYHRVLSIYAPLQGWYNVCDAWPWGLLMHCHFHDEIFCGDLVRPFPLKQNDDDDNGNHNETNCGYQIISERIFEITFGTNGQARCTMVDREEDSSLVHHFGMSFTPVLFEHVYNGFGRRNIREVYPRKEGGHLFEIHWQDATDVNYSPEHAWSPGLLYSFPPPDSTDEQGIYPSGVDIIQTLRFRSIEKLESKQHRLRLEPWIFHPYNLPSIHQSPCVPANTNQHSSTLKPMKCGLFIGNYDNMYSYCKHEILHVSYVDSSAALQDTLGSRKLPDNYQPKHNSFFIFARKVTGDIHVPAGEITWFADMTAKDNDIADNDSDIRTPTNVLDKYGTNHRVIHSWSGYGTLSTIYFSSCSWDKGWLLQLDNGYFAYSWSSFVHQETTVLYEFQFDTLKGSM